MTTSAPVEETVRHPPARDRTALARWMRVVGFALLALPVLLIELIPTSVLRTNALGTETLLIGDWVPSLVTPAAICFWAGALLVLVAPFLGRWGQGRWSRIAMRAISSTILCATALISSGALVSLILDQERFFALDGASPGGCRVVIATSFAGFHGNAVSVGVVQPGEFEVDWLVLHEYQDAGATHGAAARWDGTTGVLVLGPGAHPDSELHSVPINCRS